MNHAEALVATNGTLTLPFGPVLPFRNQMSSWPELGRAGALTTTAW